MLALCLIPCLIYAFRSRVSMGRRFWIGCIFIFLILIRRELSFLSDIYVSEHFSYLGHDYEWWEDMVLGSIGLLGIGFIASGWRYFITILKRVPMTIYIIVTVLIIFQYIGEHTLWFGKEMGNVVEEVSEGLIYTLALIYLLKFKLFYFEGRLPCASNTNSLEVSLNNAKMVGEHSTVKER